MSQESLTLLIQFTAPRIMSEWQKWIIVTGTLPNIAKRSKQKTMCCHQLKWRWNDGIICSFVSIRESHFDYQFEFLNVIKLEFQKGSHNYRGYSRVSRLITITPETIKNYNFYFSELCQAMEIEHGSMFPKEVIEGSSVTVTCDKGFRVEGDWLLRCTDGNLTGSNFTDVFPRCVHIRNGKIPIYHQAYKISTIH